ncbi:hypothetical protein MMC32_002960 [Xylographa parallela]|nr:hypothetical protein [Xylographa parallela]
MALPTLEGLPLEIKREILKHALTVDKPIYIKPPLLHHPVTAAFPRQKSGLGPNIIATSKAWAFEGRTILYRDNIFFFKTVLSLIAFTNAIIRHSRHLPFNNRYRVKHVCLAVGDEMLEYIATNKFRKHFPNLETVDLNNWYYAEGESEMKDTCMQYWTRRMEDEFRVNMKQVVVKVVNFVD